MFLAKPVAPDAWGGGGQGGVNGWTSWEPMLEEPWVPPPGQSGTLGVFAREEGNIHLPTGIIAGYLRHSSQPVGLGPPSAP